MWSKDSTSKYKTYCNKNTKQRINSEKCQNDIIITIIRDWNLICDENNC